MLRFLGLGSCIFHFPTLKRAKEWYATVLIAEPYVAQSSYVGEVVIVVTILDPFDNLVRIIQNPQVEAGK